MLHSEVQQYLWLLAALTAGAAMVAVVVLTYFPLWRKRGPAGGEGQSALYGTELGRMSYVPWVLLLICVGVTVFGVVYTVRSMIQTPNW